MSGGRWLLAGAGALAAFLVAAYLAAGGASYSPTPVHDPCQPREWRDPEGAVEAAEQFTLSALDGAACELEVSRERLVIALATPEAREELAAEHGIADAELEAAIQAGLVRAIDDAEGAGALGPLVAAPLRAAARAMPLAEAIALLRGAADLFDAGGGLLDRLDGLLP